MTETPPLPGLPESFEDLRVPPLPGEQPAEYLVRVRALHLQSTSAGDVMPNAAFITLGPQP